MLQISLFSLWQHKKSVFFLMIVYALLLSLVLTVFPLIQIVKTTIFDGLSQKYGIFHAMLFDMQQSKESILQDASIASYGKIILYDSWDIIGSASPITLGHFDETAISLGKIRLLQGAFPLNPDEIALEQNALYQFSDSPEIGDTISLSNANNERLDLKLVGILADYSTHWRIADTGYEAGRTDFPKGIITESTTLPSSAMHTLLFFAGVPLMQNDGGQIESFQFMSKYNMTEYAVNDNLYSLAYSEYLGPFDFFMVLFLIVIALSIVLVSYKAHATYLTHYESMYQKLFFLGAEDEFPFFMYGLHSLIILFLSVFCGFALSILLSFLIKVVFSVSILSQIFSSPSMVMLSISLVVFIVIQLFTYLQRIKKMRSISLSTLKADKDPINQIKIKKNVSTFLFQSSLKRNFPKLVMLLSLICVLCVFFAVSQLYFSNLTISYYQKNPIAYNDFFLDSQKLRRFKTYDSYFPFHFSKDIYFPLSIREELSRLEGIQFVTYYGTSQNPCGMTLTINDANNTYWKEWCVPDMRNLEISLIDTPSIMGMFDFNVFILDVDSLSAFQSQYPSIPTELYTTNSAILFAPDVTRYTGETSTAEATIISEEYFSSKNALSFIALESSVPPNEAIKNPEALIAAKTYTLPLAQVMHQPFLLECNGQEIQYDGPTIVLTLSTAENTGLFPGIETFSATLKRTFPKPNI